MLLFKWDDGFALLGRAHNFQSEIDHLLQPVTDREVNGFISAGTVIRWCVLDFTIPRVFNV